MKDPIIISSIPRSGSSIIAGILDICGVDTGETYNVKKPYTKHLYENLCITGMVSKAFRDSLCDTSGQYPLPARSFFLDKSFGYKCKKTAGIQGIQSPWFIKDDRLCLIWKEIDIQFPTAKWILVQRDEKHILESCRKTGFMRAFNNNNVLHEIGKDTAEEGWKWWLEQYKDKVLEIQYGVNHVRTVYPEKMLHGDFIEMQQVVEWSGGIWRDTDVRDYVEQKLRR